MKCEWVTDPCVDLFTVWSYLGHGHSDNLKPKVHEGEGSAYKIIVSRSHSGPVEGVAKQAFGDQTEVVPAGGAGNIWAMA